MEQAPPMPPPPPPMPFHLQENLSSTRESGDNPPEIIRKCGAPPRWLTSGYTLDERTSVEPDRFREIHYFFYGTLKDPKMLSHILGKPVKPSALRPASVVGYACELWGSYKALVDDPMGAIVDGVAYEVQFEEDEVRLAAYETNAYETVLCGINIKDERDSSIVHQISGKTFRYAGDPQALREKRFDRKLWVKNMAPQLGL